MTKIVLLLVLVFTSVIGKANEEVKLAASAPNTVILGKPFQITYTSNAKATNFKAPAITNFEVLAGPFKSESYSSKIVNGNMTSSVSISFTYTLQAQKTGTFSIPSAGITVDGKKYTSNGLNIKVLPADESSSSSKSTKSTTPSEKISSENLFIRPILSKANVYEQEAVKLTYKLYTTYDIVQFSNKSMPDFQGFLKQEYERTGNTQLDYENYKGRNFLTAVLYEVLLFPQSAGEISIDEAVFEAIIRVQSKKPVRSIFDDFFESYTNVSRSIHVPAVKITVKDLPLGKPSSFNGVVGRFSIQSSVSSKKVKVNDAITMKIDISGQGNMRMIKNPDLDFPEAFDVYDPKIANNFKPSDAGLSGNKSIEIMFIPRHPGNYEIPAWEFTYFDPQTRSYKQLSTPTYKIQVLKSDGTVDEQVFVSNIANKEEVKQIGNDIRYIYTGSIELKQSESYLVERLLNWLFFLVPFIITCMFFILFRKHVKENADINLVKNKKANKIARKRLKYARKLLNEGNKDKFYEEVMKALWSYLSDKLLISVSEINKEKVSAVLEDKTVEASKINKLMNVLNTCELARFAPDSGKQEMGNLYEETIGVISYLEDVLNKSV